jgi:hypothetical protein
VARVESLKTSGIDVAAMLDRSNGSDGPARGARADVSDLSQQPPATNGDVVSTAPTE